MLSVADGVRFTPPKLNPVSVTLPPAVEIAFKGQWRVIFGASNVNPFIRVPITLAMVTATVAPLPDDVGLHRIVVSESHRFVLQIGNASRTVGVGLLAPKFTPCTVRLNDVAEPTVGPL